MDSNSHTELEGDVMGLFVLYFLLKSSCQDTTMSCSPIHCASIHSTNLEHWQHMGIQNCSNSHAELKGGLEPFNDTILVY